MAELFSYLEIKMRPQKQLVLHDPENGKWGDCWRTAWAMILDHDAADVPHFVDKDCSDYLERRNAWLAAQGLCAISVPYNCALEDVLSTIRACNHEQPYLVTGTSPRGTPHVVVAQRAELLHDPHPDGGFLVGPCEDGFYWIEFVGKALQW